MTENDTLPLRVGAWRVDPRDARMTRAGDSVRLEPRMLRLLLCLAERPGQLVSADELAHAVWPGTIVTPDSVYQAIASLRRVLGDDPKAPSYLVTEPRRGYRLIAEVKKDGSGAASPAMAQQGAIPVSTDAAGGVALQGGEAAANERSAADTRAPVEPAVATAAAAPYFTWTASASVDRHRVFLFVVLGLMAFAVLGGTVRRWLAPQTTAAAVSPRSVAVLPFQDLTDSMGEEPFADGMTEELIGRLSKSGLRVPAPTAVFYYKDKQLPVPQIAAQLGVAYLLDGSVRKSGERLRIAARLMRADDGFVLWSETYERPRDDLLKVQDEIAEAVTRALAAKI